MRAPCRWCQSWCPRLPPAYLASPGTWSRVALMVCEQVCAASLDFCLGLLACTVGSFLANYCRCEELAYPSSYW